MEILRQLGQVFTWFVIITPWEQAIRVRWGKSAQRLDKGVYLKIPFVDRVFKQSVRRRLSVIRPQTLTTTDGHVINCAGAVGFSVGDLVQLYDTMENPNDTIECEVAGIVARFIGSRRLIDCTSPELEAYVRENLHLEKYGLVGQEFYTTSFATAKTYRFITGEMGIWSKDSGMVMQDVKPA